MILGKRTVNLIKNVVSSVAGNKKDTYSKVTISDLFYKNRKKFKAYYTQVRFYLWNNSKRTLKVLKTFSE
jgi:hypothetical protein